MEMASLHLLFHLHSLSSRYEAFEILLAWILLRPSPGSIPGLICAAFEVHFDAISFLNVLAFSN